MIQQCTPCEQASRLSEDGASGNFRTGNPLWWAALLIAILLDLKAVSYRWIRVGRKATSVSICKHSYARLWKQGGLFGARMFGQEQQRWRSLLFFANSTNRFQASKEPSSHGDWSHLLTICASKFILYWVFVFPVFWCLDFTRWPVQMLRAESGHYLVQPLVNGKTIGYVEVSSKP